MLRRALLCLAAVPVLLLTFHWAFRSAVSRAIAYAPNGGGLGAHLTAAVSPPTGAHECSLPVGPPRALLSTWVIEPPPHVRTRGTVLLLHGLRLNRDSMLGFAHSFSQAGYRCVLPDLRGHGASTGGLLTYGETESRDVSQLLDALEAGEHPARIHAFGYSYGGAVALRLAARDRRIDRVVTVGAFSAVRSVVADYRHRYFPALERWLPPSWLDAAIDDAADLAHFDPDRTPLDDAGHAARPILIIHGLLDRQVPPHHALALREAARHRAALVLLGNGTHASLLQDRDGAVTAAALAFYGRP